MGIETALIGSALLGTAGGIYGSEQEKKKAKGLSGTVKSYERRQLDEIEQGYGEQERLLRQANREELEGAEDAVSRFEGAGAQAIEDERARAVGAGRAGLASRGLLGSSVGANLSLAAGRAASRSYMSLGEAVSGMRQNLAARRAQGTQRLGALRGYRSQARNSVLSQSLGVLGQYAATQQSQVPNFAGIGQGLGLLAGLGYGGGSAQTTAAMAGAQASTIGAKAAFTALYGGY